MAAHRFWRLTGIAVAGGGALALSEARLYVAEVIGDAAATLSSTVSPDTGTVADLKDGSTSSVVTWSRAKHTSPGFALVWDFSSGDVEISNLRLGSGPAAGTFPTNLTMQYSDDGVFWQNAKIVNGVNDPGLSAMTTAPVPGITEPTDPLQAFVTSYLRGISDLDDTEGSLVTTYGNTTIGGLYVPTGAIDFDGDVDELRISGAGRFAPGTGAFCWEAWVTSDASPWSYPALMDTSGNGSAVGGMFLEYGPARGLTWAANNGALDLISATGSFPSHGVERHIMVSRTAAGALCLGINGKIVGLGTSTQNIPAQYDELSVGGYTRNAGNYFKGGVRGAKFTKGAHRYTGAIGDDYTPHSVPIDPFPFLPFTFVGSAIWSLAAEPLALKDADFADVGYAYEIDFMPLTFLDVDNGGQGRVRGTVKRKQDPTNVPLHRKVYLLDEASMLVVRQTFSDAITGAYDFYGVDAAARYTVLSYDSAGTFNAVVASNQIPEAITP